MPLVLAFFGEKNHHSITFPLFMRVARVMDGVMDGDSGDGFSTKMGQKMSQRRHFSGYFRARRCVVWQGVG